MKWFKVKKYTIIWNEIDGFSSSDVNEIEAYSELQASLKIKDLDYYDKLSKALAEFYEVNEKDVWKFHLVEND